jgi:AraC-like DNA-binding protein
MRRFVQIKKPKIRPQATSVLYKDTLYTPVFLHATIEQDHPVGNRRTFGEHTHGFYHIVLYTKGHGKYSKEGQSYEAKPGTCVLVHPGQRHDFVSQWEQTTYDEITFSMESPEGKILYLPFDELLSLYLGAKISLISDIMLSLDQIYVLHNLLTLTTDHLNSSKLFSAYHAQYDLAAIFNFLIKNTILTTEKPTTGSPFEAIKEYMERHYFEQFSAEELAKKAGVSKGYFFRGFKQQYGVSPLAYQQAIRIEASKTLLKTTTLRCNEIAWRVGFSDVYFFHRIFKKDVGLTPTQFRKQ